MRLHSATSALVAATLVVATTAALARDGTRTPPSEAELAQLYPAWRHEGQTVDDFVSKVAAEAVEAAGSGGTGAGLPSLRQLAHKHNVFMGAAANQHALLAGGTYTQVLGEQYNLFTAENACKWSPTEPQEDQFNLTGCRYIREQARRSNAVMRGHNLCWGNWNPGWLTSGDFNSSTLQQLLQEHIINVAGAFADDSGVIGWDVVNEALNNTGVKPSNPWSRLPGFVEVAFAQAKSTTASSQLLFYNDYGAEGSGAKSDEVYHYLQHMLNSGYKVDGVGLQMHVSTAYYPPFADVAANMARLAALGLDIHITEMDVGCKGGCDAAGLRKQAEIYAGMLRVCLQQPKCKNFETWGFSDAHSWRATETALPFDANYAPKPAFYALVGVLNATTPTPRQ